jgi:CRP-like cAMP-binding protein
MRWFRKGERKAESDNVRELISRRQYARALELLRASLQKKPGDRRLRLELSETLILSGQATQAVEVLLPLADDLVRQGFIGQARVVLKRAQDLEPGRSDVEERLDALEEIRRGSEYHRPAGMPRVIGEPPAVEPPEPLALPGEDEAVPTPDTADASPAEPARVVASVEENDDVEIPLDDVLDSSDTGPDLDGSVPESRLLRALSPDVAAALMSELRPLSCEPGEIVITEGEQAHSLHLIESGSVLVSVKDKAGRNVKVRSLEAGDFFGEIAALTGTRRTATVTAATHCRLLVAEKALVEVLVASHPQVRQLLAESFEERLGDERATAVRGKRLRRRMPSESKRRRTTKKTS